MARIPNPFVVGVAPLNGKLSTIVGRKPILFGSIGLFLLGSALCGAAQSFIWLALSRGVQGMGAGGIMQMTTITVTDISKTNHCSPLSEIDAHYLSEQHRCRSVLCTML